MLISSYNLSSPAINNYRIDRTSGPWIELPTSYCSKFNSLPATASLWKCHISCPTSGYDDATLTANTFLQVNNVLVAMLWLSVQSNLSPRWVITLTWQIAKKIQCHKTSESIISMRPSFRNLDPYQPARSPLGLGWI